MNALVYPIYYETNTVAVKLTSRYKACIISVQRTSPKISYVDGAATTQEQRVYEGGFYLRKITAEEFKNRYYIAMQLQAALSGVIEAENGVKHIACTASNMVLVKKGSEGGDRYVYEAIGVTFETVNQTYTSNIKIIINRFGEIKFGTLIFDAPITTEFGIMQKIGLAGYLYCELPPAALLLQKPNDILTPQLIHSYLYLYGIGSAVAKTFNHSFNSSFLTEITE